MHKIEAFLLSIALFICGLLGGLIIGVSLARKVCHDDLIQRGFAEYKVNPKTGGTYFSYKVSTWDSIIEGGFSQENLDKYWDERTKPYKINNDGTITEIK